MMLLIENGVCLPPDDLFLQGTTWFGSARYSKALLAIHAQGLAMSKRVHRSARGFDGKNWGFWTISVKIGYTVILRINP